MADNLADQIRQAQRELLQKRENMPRSAPLPPELVPYARRKENTRPEAARLDELLAVFQERAKTAPTEDEIAARELAAHRETLQAEGPRRLEGLIKSLPDDYAQMIMQELPRHPGIKKAELVAKSLQLREHLFIYGQAGTAKTHLALLTAKRLILQHGCTAKYIRFGRLVASQKPGGVPIDYLTPTVLIVDELDKRTNDTDFTYGVLFDLLDRMAEGKTTIFLANHDLVETATLYSQDDEANQGAIISRLMRCIEVEVWGDDYRPKLARPVDHL